MKKIALVIADLALGGGQRVTINLANALSKEYQVSIVIFQNDDIHYKAPGALINLDCPPQNSIPGKFVNVFKRAYKLRKLFKKEKFNYVYSFMETANFPTAMACPKAALSVHCNPKTWSLYESILVRLTYARAKNIVAVSDDVSGILRSDYGLKNVSRIYNPVDSKEILEQADKPYQHSKPYIVALGRYHEMKRYDLLIDAYAQSKLQTECDLIIVGDGELRDELEAQIKRLDLQDKVHLAGTQSNPFPYLAGAKFLVLSSRTEAFPMVLIEALALECPIVATDCPTGPREIVREGENGLLVENENAQALSQGMDKLYFDEKLLEHFKKNAIPSIQHLSGEVIAKEWLAL
ncbi:MAG TPA: glycosyltransferase [Leucothrix sp.]|nr:glycosyltransferase [Leucothrix sp.]HIQ15408.1 glycosyltransferase [Leucothrix sp.]